MLSIPSTKCEFIMLLRIILGIIWLTDFAAGQSCSICGSAGEVRAPENIITDDVFAFQDGQPISCGELDSAGRQGLIASNDCRSLQSAQILSTCDCRPSNGTAGSCSICGDDSKVGNRDAIFTFPGQPDVPCGILEDSGQLGLIPLESCAFLPELVSSVCECSGFVCYICGPTGEVGDPKNIITDDVFAVQGGQPVSCGELDDAGRKGLIVRSDCRHEQSVQISSTCDCRPSNETAGSCSICGDGSKVGNPDAIFLFPGQPTVPCVDLEKSGLLGFYPIQTCQFLSALVSDRCECRPTYPTSSPTTGAPMPPPLTSGPVIPIPTSSPPTPAPMFPSSKKGRMMAGSKGMGMMLMMTTGKLGHPRGRPSD